MGRILNLLLLVLVSCASLNQMNRNMEITNDLMVQNHAAIEANTVEVKHSTEAMNFLPLVGLIFLAVLFTPIFVLFRLYRKLQREISRKSR